MAETRVILTPNVDLNIRAGQGVQFDKVDGVYPGELMYLLEAWEQAEPKIGQMGQWLQVQTPQGITGYAAAWLVKVQYRPTFLTPTTSYGLWIRQAPVTGTQLQMAMQGERLLALDEAPIVQEKLGQQGMWLQVQAENGIQGFAAAWLLTLIGAPPPIVSIPTTTTTTTKPPDKPVTTTTTTTPLPGQELVYTGPPWPFGRCLKGIHDRANRHAEPGDITLAAGKFEAIKVTTGASIEEVNRYRTLFPFCRLFESWGGRILSVDNFLSATIPDMEQLVRAGVQYFEFHNEPNLTGEGLRAHGVNGSWGNGFEFAQFFIEGQRKLKQRFPGILVGFPGLSPGPDTAYQYGHDSGWRQNDVSFLQQAEAGLQAADFICVHAYYSDSAELEGKTMDLIKDYRRRWPNKLLFITEFGNGNPKVGAAEKGRQAKKFYHLCNQIPGIGAAFYYIISGSGWHDWALRHEDGKSTGILEQMLA